MIDQKKDNARVLVFGNEKGGSGKSTSAMHVAIALIRLGYKVASIDLDARQGTFTRYLKNRFDSITKTGMALPSPAHMAIERSICATLDEQQREEREFLEMALAETLPGFDFVVIDTPGTDSYLSRLAHSYADILITPMNDSFIDLDLLTRIEQGEQEKMEPSVYTKMVWEQRRTRKARDGSDIDWIVMRNRLAHISANNKKNIGQILEKIGRVYGFRVAPGFCERVIFKELFLQGMTLLDLQESQNQSMTMSQLSARQEVRQLVVTMGLLPKRRAA